mgnify:CR=1 FL=1
MTGVQTCALPILHIQFVSGQFRSEFNVHPAAADGKGHLGILDTGGSLTILTEQGERQSRTSLGLRHNRRLIVLRVGGGVKVKEVSEYALSELRGVKTSTGSLFTHIEIGGPVPFTAKFHRMGMKTNREQAMAIAAALQSKALPA